MKSRDFIRSIASEHRLLVLGGMALILHGLNRATKDVDLWLDPMSNSSRWAEALEPHLLAYGLSASRIGDFAGTFETIHPSELASVVERDHFVRILGADEPVDIFRIPTNFDVRDFDEAWARGRLLEDDLRLMDEVDIVLSKLNTGRDQDVNDIGFLENKIENAYRAKLSSCSLDEACTLLERFVTPETAYFAATKAADIQVRAYGERLLQDMVEDGNLYAVELQTRFRARARDNDLTR